MWTWRPIGLALMFGLVATVAPLDARSEPSGLVIAVVQSATVNRQTGRMILQPEAPVYSGDQIATNTSGLVQITFRDNTRLVVGPNSNMVIDAFILNEDDTARKISINVVRGAFRFITGNSRKDAYKITLPSATIGIRG